MVWMAWQEESWQKSLEAPADAARLRRLSVGLIAAVLRRHVFPAMTAMFLTRRLGAKQKPSPVPRQTV